MSLVLALMPANSGFAVEGTSEEPQAENPAVSVAKGTTSVSEGATKPAEEEEAMLPESTQPNGENVEQETAVPKGGGDTPEENGNESKEENAVLGVKKTKAAAFSGGFSIAASEHTYTLELAPLKITGASPASIEPALRIVQEDGTLVGTVAAGDLAAYSGAWDWSATRPDGFSINGVDEVALNANTLSWDALTCTRYRGTLAGLRLAITEDNLAALLADKGCVITSVADDVVIPTNNMFAVPVVFDPDAALLPKQKGAFSADSSQMTYFVDSKAGAGATFAAWLRTEGQSYPGIASATWELLDGSNADAVVAQGSFEGFPSIGTGEYPTLQELLDNKAGFENGIKVIGALPSPGNLLNSYTKYPTSDIRLKATLMTSAGELIEAIGAVGITVTDDTEAPEVTLTATGTARTDASASDYYYESRILTLAISDENLQTADAYGSPAYKPAGGEWTKDTSVSGLIKFTLEVDAEGLYDLKDFVYSATDAAGKTTELSATGGGIGVAPFVIDTTDPTAIISPAASSGSGSNEHTYPAGIAQVTLSGDDATSGLWRYEYLRIPVPSYLEIPSDATYDDLLVSYGEDSADFPSSASPIVTVPQGQDDRFVYVLKVWDRAGNFGYAISSGIIVDTTKPIVKGLFFEEENRGEVLNGIYNDSVSVRFTAHDVSVASAMNPSIFTASGLSGEAGYELYYLDSDGNRVSGEPFESKVAIAPNPQDKLPDNPTWSEIETSLAPSSPWSFVFEIDGSNDRYPQIEVVVYVLDRSGNTGTLSDRIAIDTTAPVVEISYDNNDVVNGTVFTANRVATLKITDLNFDPSEKESYGIAATRSDRSLPNPEAWPLGSWVIGLVGDKASTVASTSIVFDKDGDYTLNILSLTDRAGNQIAPDSDLAVAAGTEAPWEFVIDTVEPKLEISYVDEYNNIRYDDSFFRGRGITVTVTDDSGFEPSAKPYTIQFEKDGVVTTANLEYSKSNELKWSGNLAGGAFNNLVDGAYDFSHVTSTAVDRSLRGASYVSSPGQIDSFIIDSGNPAAVISLDRANADTINYDPQSGKEYTYPGERTGQMVSINIFGEDRGGSGVWRYQYFRASPESVASIPNDAAFSSLMDEFAPGTAPVDIVKDANNYDGTFVATNTQENEDRYLYVLQVTDRAGNTAYFVSNGLIVDTAKPLIPEIKLFGENENPSGIYTSDVAVSFASNDREYPAITGAGVTTASGLLDKASYRVEYVKPDGSLETAIAESFVQTAASTIGTDPTWTEILNDLVGTKDFAFSIPGTVDEYQTIRATVTVFDRAGNAAAAVRELSIDTTQPVVVVSYDNNAAENGRYFKAKRVATVDVIDANFDANLVWVDSQKPVSWEAPRAGHKSGAGGSGIIVYSDEGEYTLGVTAADKAGNPAIVQYEGAAPRDFIVDSTAPVLALAYDNNNVQNERYYNAVRTGTITVTEQNFSSADIRANVTQDGAAISPSLSWSSLGDTHSGTLLFGTDGDYTLNVNYIDLAGNPANAIPEEDFIIDLTAPVIEFTGSVQNRMAYAGAVTPELLFHDRNYDTNADSRSIGINGYKNGQIPLYVSYSSIEDGERAIVADLEHLSVNDDVYVLTANLTDLAGNKTVESIAYSVNRFGSTWYLEGTSKELIDNYYSNITQEVRLHEVNVSEIIDRSVSLSHDGALNMLEESRGYQVVASGGETTWREYVYVFGTENFENEGLYEITVLSTDAASNTSSNVSPRIAQSACPVSFVIDRTAPTIVLTGVEEGGSYADESRTVLIDVQDNTVVTELNIFHNKSAAPTKHYDGNDLELQKGQISYVLKASDELQELIVVASDAAGNISDRTGVSGIRIGSETTSIPEALVARTASIGGAVFLPLAIVAAITGLVFLALRRRNRLRREAR
jgi:hypothetical protein